MVEGGKRSTDQLVCLWGAPSPVYKGVEEGEGPALLGAPQGESYSHRELDSNPSNSRSRREGRRRDGEGKGGCPPFLVQFRPEGEGACGLP